LLARRLERLAEVYRQRTGYDVTALAHSGAAGGLAGGLAALGARLEPGFEVVARAAGFEAALDGVDLVLTGEGRFDRTSLDGKVTGEVLGWAAAEGVAHRAVVAGQVTDDLRRQTGVPLPAPGGNGTPVEEEPGRDAQQLRHERLPVERDPAHAEALGGGGQPQVLDGQAHRVEAGVGDGVAAEDGGGAPGGVVGDDDRQGRLHHPVDLDVG